MTDDELYQAALAATRHSYSPYSHLQVGAVLQTTDGALFPGVNVEFSSYGLSICAERSAIASAVSAGYRDFSTIAVARSDGGPISPCGMCRQSLSEFGPLSVIYRGPDGLVNHPIDEMMPDPFPFDGDA